MDLTEFKQKRVELEERLRSLREPQEPFDDAVDDDALAVSLKQLHAAIEELSIAEEELQAQNEELIATRDECEAERHRYHDLFEFCPDAYIVTDMDGVISEANRVVSTLIGRDPHTLIGKPLEVLIAKDDRSAFLQRMGEVSKRCRIDDWEVKVNCSDGDAIPVSISVMLGQERDGGEGEMRWMMRDLTAARESETAMLEMREHLRRCEQMTAIGTLAAGLGHDVKNLLFPMRVRLNSLSRQDLPPQAAEDAEGLRHSVGYLQQLAANLQLMAERPDPSQVIQGRTELEAWWEHVSPLIRTATRASVQVEARFESDLPPLNIAPHLLTQAVMNLVNNASEVMTDGGRIHVWAKRTKHGPFVRLGVTDEGPGMAPEVLSRALDPFFTTKTRDRGLSTGMGLSLVRGIIKSVAGSVRIDSTPGRGTSVILRLPVAPEQDQAKSEALGNVPHAAVSVSDSHLASTLCTLLNLSRLPSWRCDPHDPGDCTLWIVEPETIEPAMAREYLRSDEKRRMVLFGHKSEPWSDVPAVWIDRSASLAAIRDALSQVAFEVLTGR